MSRFESKRVVVTGGSSGIGRATAARLVREGARVVITGRDRARLEAAAAEIGAIPVVNDASEPSAATELALRVKELLGGLDAVFLNAGSGRIAPLDDVTAAHFDDQYAVLVRGPLLQAKALAPLLEDGGSILFNTSIGHEKGMAGLSVYTSAKGAVRTLTRALARELAPRDIRVNAVSPGPVETGFFEATGLPAEHLEGIAAQILTQVPLGRFGRSDEIAAAAAFLLSADASFVTGAELAVDGGMAQL